MPSNPEFWQVLLISVQALIALAGFLGAVMINQLIKAINKLAVEDATLHSRITSHREDMLSNYSRTEHIENVRKDLIGRVDRFENTLHKMFSEHEARETEHLANFRELIFQAIDRRAGDNPR